MSWLVLPYGRGRKVWWAIGLAAVWTWPAWLYEQAAAISTQWTFGLTLRYFAIASVTVWLILTALDSARHFISSSRRRNVVGRGN